MWRICHKCVRRTLPKALLGNLQCLTAFHLLILLLYTLHETTFEVLFKVKKTTINIVCVRIVPEMFCKKQKNTDAY